MIFFFTILRISIYAFFFVIFRCVVDIWLTEQRKSRSKLAKPVVHNRTSTIKNNISRGTKLSTLISNKKH